MTKLQTIREFASIVAKEKVVISKQRDDWGICLSYPYPYLILPKDLMKNTEGDKDFRADFVYRCPMARGFANVTLSILHEIGHHFNREEYINQDPTEYDNATGIWHFMLPCEIVATDWAIEWLQEKAHRVLAKEFERKFFGY